MKIYTVVEHGSAHVFLSKEKATDFTAGKQLDPSGEPSSQIQEHELLVNVAVCVENGFIERAIATSDIMFDVYDCDGQDIIPDDNTTGESTKTVGDRAREEFDELAKSPGYITIY